MQIPSLFGKVSIYENKNITSNMYELFVTSQLIHHHNSTFLSLKWIRLQKAMEKTRTLKSRLVVLERLVWKHKLENALLDENFDFFFFPKKYGRTKIASTQYFSFPP